MLLKLAKELTRKEKEERKQLPLNCSPTQLIYSRILTPGSKRASHIDAQKMLEQPSADLHLLHLLTYRNTTFIKSSSNL